MFKLTEKALKYGWADLNDKYTFTNWDIATRDWTGEKSPREKRKELGKNNYSIFFVEKNQKKRTGCFSLEFDDNGNYIGFETPYKVKFPVEDIIRFKEDAIKWLLDNGYIALTEKR